MTGAPRFAVERIDDLRFTGPDLLATSELMSPYVWRQNDGRLGILVRVVENPANDGSPTGTIWYGSGDDGLAFSIEDGPVLAPDPDGPDAKGCEDPTVVRHDGELVVFYTGVDANGDGRLLWASGPDIRSLTKRGVAHDSREGEQDVKEAEVAVGDDGHWTMGFEFARDEASNIGYAEGEGPSGPWRSTKHGFGARGDHFDCWHLSPGPMLLNEPERFTMFYNGASRDGQWSIGWVVFDHENDRILDRCERPLVPSPGEVDGRNMAFAASLLDNGATIDLYLSFNDRTCHRAIVSRGDQEGSAA